MPRLMQAVLEEYPCPGSCFVVRSGYRTRSEGDSVVFKEVRPASPPVSRMPAMLIHPTLPVQCARTQPPPPPPGALQVITLKSQGFRGMFIAPGKLAITEHSMLPPLPAAAAETSQSYELSAGSVRGRFKVGCSSSHPAATQATQCDTNAEA